MSKYIVTFYEGEHIKLIEEMQPLICCKDCKYYGEADSVKPEYHECKYFSNWARAVYILENDFCSCAERKDEVD